MSSSRRVPADRLKLFPPMFNSWETTSSIFQIGIFTSVNITNHLSTNNTPDVIVEASSGGSPQTVPANVPLLGKKQLNISVIPYTPDATGNFPIVMGNIRWNANSAAGGPTPLLTATITATGHRLRNWR